MYQKVVYLNHLNHKEIVETFAEEFKTFAADYENKNAGGLRVLDIGVGDGWLPMQLFSLAKLQLDQFTGVDSTAEALEIAKTTSALSLPTKNQLWQQADMLVYMTQCPSSIFHVIYSSYTIHHLDSDKNNGKPALLENIYRCLSADGLFLWADVYNVVPGRSRDDTVQLWYKERFRKYQGLTEEEITQVWDHVREFDIPEEMEVMKQMMVDAGFVDVKLCFEDKFYTIVLAGRKKKA